MTEHREQGEVPAENTVQAPLAGEPAEAGVQPAPPAASAQSAVTASPAGAPLAGTAVPARTREERHAALAQAVARAVASGGRVESQSDYQAVIVNGKRVNHLLHFLIGVFTIGAWWLFVWLPLAIFGGEKREIIQVDEYGNALIQRL